MKQILIPIAIFSLLFTNCNSADHKSNSVTESYSALDEEFEGSSGYESYEEPPMEDQSASTVSSLAKSSYKVSANGNISTSNQLQTNDLKQKNNYNTKIIKNADLKIKVTDVKKASNKIANLVDMNGGYVSNENLTTDKSYYQSIEVTDEYEINEYEYITSNIIYIRVPSKSFQSLLSSMKGLALSEDYIRINAKDVTEEYFDLETRLKTKKEVEARYIAILKSKAKTLEEILLAEDKIRVIREEIEAVEGRLNYLKNKVSLSTIQVEIYQDSYYEKETTRFKKYETTGWSFGEKANDALSSGWEGILWFLVGLLYFWPFLIIGVGVYFFVRYKIKKRRQK